MTQPKKRASAPRKPKKPKAPAVPGMPGGGGGGMPDMSQMMGMVQQMQADMAAAQESLAEQEIEATVGGGVVTVVATGDQQIKQVTIDPEAVDPDDVEMLQDLIVAGVNEALRLAKEQSDARLGSVTGGIDLGSLGLGSLGGLLGG